MTRSGKHRKRKSKKEAISDLAGFIFICSTSTKADCFKYRVFGLNVGKKSLVEQIQKGMHLFLFDIDLRLLYGIYKATSNGSYKLERRAFGGAYRWQVRFSIQKDCLPLPEDVFEVAIKENYIGDKKFKCELTSEQVNKLVNLFRPLPANASGSPPRSRMAAPDKFEVAAESKVPRYPENDRYVQDRSAPGHLSPREKYDTSYMSSDLGRLPPMSRGHLSPRAKYDTSYMSSDLGRLPPMSRGHLSPRAKYDTSYMSSELGRLPPMSTGHLSPRAKYDTSYMSSELGRLAPMSKYEINYTDSDRYRAERQIASYSHSTTKYAQPHTPEEHRILDARLSDDPYFGRALRLQQELTQHSQAGTSSHVAAPSSLSTYGADPLRPFSDLRLSRARDELYSLHSQGSKLSADVDPLYRQRLLVPDVRADVLDRRVAGLDPLVDSHLTYQGGLSGDLLRARLSNDVYPSSTAYGGVQRNESAAGLPFGGITDASGPGYRGDLLPHSRYY